MDSKASIFLPVYNIGEKLKYNLKKVYDVFMASGNDFEIIVVDDNSSDRSYSFEDIVETLGQSADRYVRYISYNNGPSRRENLAKSFSSAKYGIIGFTDADLQYDASYLLKLLKIIKNEKADIVIGSRYIKGGKAKRPLTRKLYSFIYRIFIKVLFDTKIHDHQCGLKFFRKKSIMPVIKKMGYDDKYIRGWFWDAELLIRAQREKLNIIEIPVESRYPDSSSNSMFRELKALKSIIKLKKDIAEHNNHASDIQ